MLRTHTCGELRKEQLGQTVTLSGWVHTHRDQGGLIFFNLRDRYGMTQVAIGPEQGETVAEVARDLHQEYVVSVTGEVAPRPEAMVNRKMDTGEIELRPTSITLLNKSLPPPVIPAAVELPSEETRLKYRYLDLRRPEMKDTLLRRHRMVKGMRDYFDEQEFVEVETPILGRSTPEGARDYLVPSRIANGSFYALPQSPQIYKQILMIAGYDRYIQVARCFRDEDLRADRQPEFTQLDMEMSFVEMDDILGVVDGLVAHIAGLLLNLEVQLPLPRMTYDEAMERFGHDAPDLRYGMELVDVTDLAGESGFRVFENAAGSGGRVRGINAPGAAKGYSRKRIDELTEFVQGNSPAKGVVWFKVEEGGKLASPTAKNFSDQILEQIGQRLDAKPGDLLLFIADDFDVTCKALHLLRKRFGEELKLYDPQTMHFSWVVEFPMFEWDAEEDRWAAKHHPFTAPRPEDIEKLESDPGACRAIAYDLVINGSEAAGGTIRIHDAGVQQQVFKLLGIQPDQAQERFGFLLDALSYGAPPHGGIALGIDRWVMTFAGRDSIRDCIAFPKTQKATDLMTGAPGEVDDRQLSELGIELHKRPDE
ncbi:MAG: aspartate--tRNA ligase [Pirellulales bacterium]|nr:aspartate--tRNA ligase [Pirellulales bacterium]